MRRIAVRGTAEQRTALLASEWLVTNGLGGYASGTIGGAPSRRYHGVLVAALPPPHGRRVLLTDLHEELYVAHERVGLLTARAAEDDEHVPLTEFRLELGLPVWTYDLGGIVVEKRLLMPHGQNTVYVLYELKEGAATARLDVSIATHHRSHDASVATPIDLRRPLERTSFGHELALAELPLLKLMVDAARVEYTERQASWPERRYSIEESRGYMDTAAAWTPGLFSLELVRGRPAAIVASVEPWEVVTALSATAALAAERERRRECIDAAAPAARDGLAAELVLAADQFIVTPVGRAAEAARVRARGDDERSVIAGYHWFTDWGRDTMISLEGLTLLTGRAAEAKGILRTFTSSIRDGLVPNLFPEGESQGLYHTADATLWLFHALDRYLAATSDRALLLALLPQLLDVVERHMAGTRFGIGVDNRDGLLRQGAPGFQLTWMDAKVGDWVVTPRRGKAVELNALWYNALCLMQGWTEQYGGAENVPFADHARRARASFNERFWYEDGGYLYDVIDGERGNEACCRPNQVFAIALPHPILDRERWDPVMKVVRERLLTPVGLRSLAPDDPDYKARYYGDLRARDAAYHQGTVWAWLIGPYIDAELKLPGADRAKLRELIAGFDQHLDEACVGQISEVFDAEAPFLPRGCVAQAWSVAEVLRCWLKLA
ncbi:MAG TPA: amylo-alpha-1,6-glucosidase [Gammaproteobacteria bacterium]|nr:amylo-alpha-1,6-glucosidase [Gammaproteobacteria bacterium]